MENLDRVIEELERALRVWLYERTDRNLMLVQPDVVEDALEWLKKLAKCNHDCKIDCLLESFNRVVAKRDELLEKQKPVEPYELDDTWKCGACDNGVVGYEELTISGIVEKRYDYCPMCGRKVKWDD